MNGRIFGSGKSEDGSSKGNVKRPHPSLGEMRGAVEDLLAELDMDKAAVRMGNTHVSTIFVFR